MNLSLSTPLQSIPRISPAYQKRLFKLGVKTVADLLYHFPHRYDDFSNIKNIGDLKLNETATVRGEIIEIKNIRTWKKRIYITEAHIQDKTGTIKAVWFNQPFLINALKGGDFVSLAGKVNIDKGLYLSNPAYEKINPIRNAPSPPLITRGGTPSLNIREGWGELKHTSGLIPVYPETMGLTSRWLRYIIKLLLPKFLPEIRDFMPLETKRSQGLMDLNDAVKQIHFPKSQKHAQKARRRLAFDEFFLIQLSALSQKQKWQEQKAPKIKFNEALIKNFVGSLPFRLTDAQRKAAWEILQDLEKPKPMNRLLEGDVGSGKTVVAAIAMLEASSSGWQTALMAPTEILAQQHFKTISELLEIQNITIGLLTGSGAIITKKINPPQPSFKKEGNSSLFKERIGGILSCDSLKRSDFLHQISSGQIQILIGTHALIQENTAFKNLALVVVDEQHRFGVAQRAALQNNVKEIEDGSVSTIPHLLSMTATPIPRTLALTAYGDLDISLLDEMPKGRQEIITKTVPPSQRQQAYEFIRQQIKQGRQAFVICPRIERPAAEVASGLWPAAPADIAPTSLWDSRSTQGQFRQRDVKAVKQEYEKLSQIIFPDLKIAILHGKIKPKEKEKIMQEFKAGKADILVSTSVVEVGVDVPNAAIIMIEGAERFGLAQLHQFRGRVGRGQYQSYCLLLTTSGADNARLRALLKCKSGFELAEKDLAIRGPGEFFGTQQWGLPDLSMASLADTELIKQARLEAAKILTTDPSLKNYPLLKDKLKKFQSETHLE